MKITVFKSSNYIRKNIHNIWIISVILLLGIVTGAIVIFYLNPAQKAELIIFIKNFFKESQYNHLPTSTIFISIFKTNCFMLALIWLSGYFNKYTNLLSFFIIFLKGLTIGFTAAFFAGAWSYKGILFSFICFLPDNLMLIPIYYIITINALSHSGNLYAIKNRINMKNRINLDYLVSGIILLIVLAGISLIEAFLLPSIFNVFSSFFI